MPNWILLFLSLVEMVLLFVALSFFLRLKKSEALLLELQQQQESLLERLRTNTELEAEVVLTFEERQSQLARLDRALEEKVRALKNLINEAERTARSPEMLRRLVLSGQARGKTPKTLARETGLSLDEVELILAGGR